MVSDEVKLKADLYWKMYNEHATQARHHETLRGTISTILVAVSAGTVSALNLSQGAFGSKYHLHVGLMLVAVGALGGLISYKHYERNRLHVSALRQFRTQLDDILRPIGGSISIPNSKGREAHKVKYWLTSEWLRLHHLWMAIFIFIIGAGVLIARS